MFLPTNFKGNLASNLKKLAGVMPVGTPWWGFDPKAKPAGVQLYAGQLLARSSYEAHWSLVSSKRTVLSESEWQARVAADGFCPFYSSGDGSATYRMPLIKGVHPKFVAALAEAGQYVEAGLPNITGNTAYRQSTLSGTVLAGGAFYSGDKANTPGFSTSNAGASQILFDASRSNPIYGASDTVQPPSVTCILGEYVVGSVAVIGEANAESLLAGQTLLDGKVGALEGRTGTLENGNGFNSIGKAEIVSWGMPDYSAGVDIASYYAKGYTAPKAGFVSFAWGNITQAVVLLVNGIQVSGKAASTGGGAYASGVALVSQGDVVKVSGADAIDLFMFFPLKGV